MAENPFLRKPRRYEEDAFRMEQLEYKKGSKSRWRKSGRLSDAYKKAAEEYEEKGFLERAFSNYKDARKFAPEQTKDEIDNRNKIENKLVELGEKIKGTLKFPKKKSRGLERHLGFAVIAMVSLVSALFFSVFSLTGSVVQGLNKNNSLWIGIILFVVGLVFTFLYNKTKK